MINVPSTNTSTNNLEDFTIELRKHDASYRPGEKIAGQVVVICAEGQLNIMHLKLHLFGVGRLKVKTTKKDLDDIPATPTKDDVIYLKKDWNIVSHPYTLCSTTRTVSYPFEEQLPSNLPTSYESKFGRVIYTTKAVLSYKDNDGETRQVTAIRGLSITENVDLNVCSQSYFDKVPMNCHRKYGLCSCVGGHMRCTLSIERTAFVCGESVLISGRMENKSDRRIEKVSVTIQQILRLGSDTEDGNAGNVTTETIDIHEDSLALFVDAGANIKIDRRLHIPPLPPSTPSENWLASSHGSESIRRPRLSISGGRISLSSLRSSAATPSRPLPMPFRRILSISYSLAFRIKSGGVDVMEMHHPVVIGSVPLLITQSQQMRERIAAGGEGASYRQCKADKPIKLLNERESTACTKAMLTHVNKYPFYMDLTTSSKQSKKISMLASTIRAEAKLMRPVREGVEAAAGGRRMPPTEESFRSDTIDSSTIDEYPESKAAYDNTEYEEEPRERSAAALRKAPIILEIQEA